MATKSAESSVVFVSAIRDATVKNLCQNNWASTAATFSLPNLSMSFSSNGC
jgi:hypothetical protein